MGHQQYVALLKHVEQSHDDCVRAIHMDASHLDADCISYKLLAPCCRFTHLRSQHGTSQHNLHCVKLPSSRLQSCGPPDDCPGANVTHARQGKVEIRMSITLSCNVGQHACFRYACFKYTCFRYACCRETMINVESKCVLRHLLRSAALHHPSSGPFSGPETSECIRSV